MSKVKAQDLRGFDTSHAAEASEQCWIEQVSVEAGVIAASFKLPGTSFYICFTFSGE